MNSLKTALQSLYRNFSMSIASIILVTLTLLVLSGTIILALNVSYITENVFQSLRINVYLDDNLQQAQKDDIQSQIEGLDNVSSIVFSSKEDELANLAGTFEDGDLILEYMSEDNPLKDVFIVNLVEIDNEETKTNAMKTATESISAIDGVESADYGAEEGTDSLIKTLDFIKLISNFASITLLVITVFLITNTVKLTINARRREIAIMRLVGAKSWYIRAPFIVEGMIIGLIGGVAAYVLSAYGYGYALDLDAITFLRTSLIPAESLSTSVLVTIPVVGMLIGSTGSVIAIRGYLKV
ncbi:permease-like cell division protein FtsX [Mollicutes bacterium LVI A0039]|nr:permease-like cell division protein FtsX [Mollicutes bacterium LVI A0039]